MVHSFEYWNPTRLIFGKGVVEQLPEVLRPIGKRVLLAYGGGSIKKIGLYQKVVELLKGEFEVIELSGIEPNPKYDPSVLEGVRLCKEHNIDVILAVGGGSVLDCTKAIAAGAKYDGDPWDLITYKVKGKEALPIVDIMTLAATGSEYDMGGVISRTETNDKVAYLDQILYPVCSLLDPTYTFSVNAKHTAAGVADAMNHVLEQYLCAEGSEVADGICETILKTLMRNAPIAIKDPHSYDARSEIMLACTYGCNGSLAVGNTVSSWPMHSIEHALSAYYDITHGEGLAIITPRFMSYILGERTVGRIAKLGRNIFGLSNELPDMQVARLCIDGFYNFFESIGIPMHLTEVGIDDSRLKEMADHIVAEGLDDPQTNYVPLTSEDIEKILRNSL